MNIKSNQINCNKYLRIKNNICDGFRPIFNSRRKCVLKLTFL